MGVASSPWQKNPVTHGMLNRSELEQQKVCSVKSADISIIISEKDLVASLKVKVVGPNKKKNSCLPAFLSGNLHI